MEEFLLFQVWIAEEEVSWRQKIVLDGRNHPRGIIIPQKSFNSLISPFFSEGFEITITTEDNLNEVVLRSISSRNYKDGLFIRKMTGRKLKSLLEEIIFDKILESGILY